jgi:hypothetical protein
VGADDVGLAEGDGEAEAEAVSVAPFGSFGAEALGSVGEEFRGEAGAVVAYDDGRAVDRDLGRRRAVAVGVEDQVGDEAVETARVGLGDRVAGHPAPRLQALASYGFRHQLVEWHRLDIGPDDHMVQEELEDTEALRIILYKLFGHLPAPPLLDGLPAVWAAGRALAGPVIGTITVASLPEPFRRRAGLPEVPGAQTLMQSVYVAVGLARFLPGNRLRAEGLTGLLHCPRTATSPKPRRPPRCAAG